MFAWKTPLSGVQYAAELEWRLVAAWANYTWEQFCELSGQQMSAHVAAYRTEKQIEAVLASEHARRMHRQARESGDN